VMTMYEFREILSRIRYKQGARIIDIDGLHHRAREDERLDLEGLAMIPVADVNGRGDLWLARSFVIPASTADEHSVVRAVHEAFRELERHECDEWFTYRGERVFDPHVP
jgi:hypothetical protein